MTTYPLALDGLDIPLRMSEGRVYSARSDAMGMPLSARIDGHWVIWSSFNPVDPAFEPQLEAEYLRLCSQNPPRKESTQGPEVTAISAGPSLNCPPQSRQVISGEVLTGSRRAVEGEG